jgi:hypothetical protein
MAAPDLQEADPVCSQGAPISYKWDLEACSSLREDVKRYEAELTELFNSDDSEWAPVDVVCFRKRITCVT